MNREILENALVALSDGQTGSSLAHYFDEATDDKDKFTRNGFLITKVDFQGGDEGGGEELWRVYEITEKKTKTVLGYVKFEGEYSSYGGTEYNNDWTQVEPFEVTVTQYREVK